MARNERTSKAVASKASKVLRDPNASPEAKSVAASALSQAPDRETDGPVGRLSSEGLSMETRMSDETNNAQQQDDDTSKGAQDTKSNAPEGAENAGNSDAMMHDTGDTPSSETGTPGDDGMSFVAETGERPDDAEEGEQIAGFDDDEGDLEDDKDDHLDKLEKNGLKVGPDNTLRTLEGKVVYAPPGSQAAADNGVQQDASGVFNSAQHPDIVRIV